MAPVDSEAVAKAKADEAAKVAEIKARQAAEQQAADEAAAKKAAEQKAADIAAAKKQVKANMAAAKSAEKSKPADTTGVSTQNQNGDNPAQAKAREALANSLFNMSSDTAVTPVTPVAPATTAATPGVVVTPTPVAQPMKMVIAPAPIGMAPPLPISAEKQQKLQALLAKYRMDQVTPEEYQTQRAAILAEP